jgi:hypothetical protein
MYLGDIYGLALKGPTSKLNFDLEIPQANTVDRILKVVLEVASGITSKEDLKCLAGVSDRQKGYYLDAVNYLGFIEVSGANLKPTKVAQLCRDSDATGQVEILIGQMFGMYSIRNCFLELVDLGITPNTKDYKNKHMKRLKQLVRTESQFGAARDDYSDVTIERRAESAHSWLKWIFSHVSK